MNKQEEFLKGIKDEAPVLETDKQFDDLLGTKTEAPKVEETTPEKDEETPNTRRYRRLQDKLQAEREANIALNERVKVLSELEKYSKDNAGEIDPDLVKAFGTTDDGKALTNIFSKKFREVQERAEEAAFSKIQAEQARVSEEEAKDSNTIDEAFENIEDQFNVDLSGSTKASKDFRNGFIDFIEEMSPKDKNGDIIEYADFETAFEAYQKISSKDKPREVSDRQKELASRSMTHSGAPVVEKPKGPITFKTVGRMLDNLRSQQM